MFLVLEKFFLGRFLEKLPAFFRHGYLLLAALFSFVIFNGAGLAGAAADLSGMLGLSGAPLISPQTLYYLSSYALLLVAAAVGATPLPKRIVERLLAGETSGRVMAAAQPVVLAALLLVCTAYLVDGSFNPFLYFRF